MRWGIIGSRMSHIASTGTPYRTIDRKAPTVMRTTQPQPNGDTRPFAMAGVYKSEEDFKLKGSTHIPGFITPPTPVPF